MTDETMTDITIRAAVDGEGLIDPDTGRLESFARTDIERALNALGIIDVEIAGGEEAVA